MVDPAHDVAEHGCPARRVVQVNGHHRIEAGLPVQCRAEIVEVVVPDDVPALRPVAPDVERSGVAGLRTYAIDFIELENVVVAPEQYGIVGCIVDPIVCHAVTHAAEEDGGPVRSDPAAEVVDIVVQREVPAGFERLAVAAPQDDAVLARVVDLAGNHTVVRPGIPGEHRVVVDAAFEVRNDPADRHGDRPDIPQRASRHQVVVPADDFHAAAAGAFEDKPPERNVLAAMQHHQWRLQQ